VGHIELSTNHQDNLKMILPFSFPPHTFDKHYDHDSEDNNPCIDNTLLQECPEQVTEYVRCVSW
jgi:hypothetical protein